MAQIFKSKKPLANSVKAKQDALGNKVELIVSHMDHLGRGVCNTHQPIIFVEGALPGETVIAEVAEVKDRFWQAKVTELIDANTSRIAPFCSHYLDCGGCQTQHCEAEEMLNYKQAAIDQLIKRTPVISEQNKRDRKGSLRQNAKLKARNNRVQKISDFQSSLQWQSPIRGDETGYRRKTRFAIDARDPNKVHIGFKREGSNKIVDIHQCEVLESQLQKLILPLKKALLSLDNTSAIGHINLIKGEDELLVNCRVVKQLSASDRQRLIQFATDYECQMALQGQNEQREMLTSPARPLTFKSTNSILLQFEPDDFIQTNNQVNQKMVAQALDWLALDQNDNLLDLFCGTGNFSLPASRRCNRVLGVEGVTKMVHRAAMNAQLNHIGNASFLAADLSNEIELNNQDFAGYNKVLLDPAREGALSSIVKVASLKPSHLVYVSCNPASFARDAAKLIEQKFRIAKIGLMDMFPQTSHTELMALFVPR